MCSKKEERQKTTFRKSIRNRSDRSIERLPEEHLFKANELNKDGILLPYRSYTKYQARIKYLQRLEIKSKDAYKIKSKDLQKRLHVDNPLDDVRSVTNIDKSYFRYIQTYPTLPIVPLYKSLKFQFHEHLRMTQEVGYRRDHILNIEHNHKQRLQKYKASVQNYIKQTKLFDEFISQDYQKSMECLRKSSELVAQVIAKQSEKQYLANKVLFMQNSLIGLNYMYYVQQKYGRFLYYLSPPSWRYKHRDFARSIDIEAKGFDLGSSSEEESFNVIFKNMQNECCRGFIKPALYFDHADSLLAIFEDIENQEFHHFTVGFLNDDHIKNLTKTLIDLKTDVENECNFVAGIITEIEERINFFEERITSLKAKFMKILNGMFYDTVAATDVLRLQINLEYCFKRIFIERATASSMSIAKDLESLYGYYSLKLCDITSDKITEAMNKSNKIEELSLKKAQNAARELRIFNELRQALLRAHKKSNVVALPDFKLPLISKTTCVLKPTERASSQREFTEAEMEYLTLFTDWTEKEDPNKYFHD